MDPLSALAGRLHLESEVVDEKVLKISAAPADQDNLNHTHVPVGPAAGHAEPAAGCEAAVAVGRQAGRLSQDCRPGTGVASQLAADLATVGSGVVAVLASPPC